MRKSVWEDRQKIAVEYRKSEQIARSFNLQIQSQLKNFWASWLARVKLDLIVFVGSLDDNIKVLRSGKATYSPGDALFLNSSYQVRQLEIDAGFSTLPPQL